MLPTFRTIALAQVVLLVLVLLVAAAPAAAQPTFSKVFEPDTIGPGSASLLTFTIDNTGGGAVINLAFTDNLPAFVFLADPAVPTTDCPNATLSAPDGGTTITFSDGELTPGATCTVEVLVTSSTVGTHMNLSGDLTSSAGNSGTASAELTVDADRPSFTKSFSPSSVPLGSRSTLTFTIDNSASTVAVTNLRFIDDLPTGLVVADPANVVNTCEATIDPAGPFPPTTYTGGIVTAEPGTGTIRLDSDFGTNAAAVLDGDACTLSVDVVAEGIGPLDNVAGDLTSNPPFGFTSSSGRAVATLTSTAGDLVLVKDFLGDPVPPGGMVDLEFTILNRTRSDDATDVGFTDNLDATLSGLVATGLPASVCGGTVSGTSTLTFTGGFVAAEGECSFTVTLQVPAGATPGVYPDTTTAVTADLGGSPVVGNQASDDLFVFAVPSLEKTFLDNPVGGGDSTRMEFTLTNTSTTSDATDIDFTDDLAAFLGAPPAVSSLPAAGFCGVSSSAFYSPTTGLLSIVDASLAAGDSCTFEVILGIPAGFPGGTYTNVTSEVSATVGGDSVVGSPASADLEVAAAPRVLKSFTDDPVQPGDTVTLEFTLEHDEFAATDATSITFDDDLNATLSGLIPLFLPASDVCGSGSQISETGGVLSLTDGVLAPGESCTFSVTLQVPVAASPGTYPNTTTDVSATVSGVTTLGSPATDDLLVTGLSFTKQFVDDPVIAGDTATLRFTIRNDGTADATNMSFTDDLDAALSGLVATGLPANDVCGSGSSISGTNFLTFSGGNLLAGTFCTFDVVVQVPAAATDGQYPNVTSALSATEGGAAVTLPPAADALDVDSTLLQLSKQFVGDPVQPGNPVTMELVLTNLDATRTASSIAFTDDLDSALTGLQATSGSNNCGIMLGFPASNLSFSGISLNAGASCTITLSLDVPAAAPAGLYTNTTSDATGNVGGLAVTGAAASDDLRVVAVTFSKSFDGPSVAGGAPVLTFTLTNLDATSGVASLAFTDDLDAVLAGLTATGLPQSDVCGSGSSISGTSLLTFSGGELAAAGSPGDSCTFQVTLDVPAGAAAGTYPNATSELTSAGIVLNDPATADLVIEPPPTFAKVFAPDSRGLGQTSSLTFTIDNSASAVDADSLDFTDVLPAGLEVATVPNASTTCTGGSVGATAGSGTVSYSGGTVAAGATCTVAVDVVPTAPGSLVNTTGDLTSSSGNSGTATDTLVANPQPGFAKVFVPDLIPVDGTSTLTFTIDNTGSTVDATGLDFTDVLPAPVVVAATPAASTTCTGGTLGATAGSGTVSYSGGTVAAGTTCTVQADVTTPSAGSFDNLSGDLTSSLGSSGPAADTLEAVDTDLTLEKSFVSSPVLPGGTVDVEYTLTNLSADFAATAISFTDDYDAALAGLAATGLPASDVCGAGSQASGTSVLSLTGGNLAPSASCTFTVTLSVPATAAAGSYPGLTSQVDATVDGVAIVAPPASDDLVVADLVFAKSFQGTAAPGQSVTLQFTLENPDPVNAATSLAFTDDLDAFVPGATATDLPQSDVCGVGSQLTGTSVITLTNGTLAGGASCTFQVSVLLPGDAAGTYLNSTSSLEGDVGGSPVSLAPAGAQAELTVGGGILEIPVLDARALALLALLLALVGLRAVRLG